MTKMKFVQGIGFFLECGWDPLELPPLHSIIVTSALALKVGFITHS